MTTLRSLRSLGLAIGAVVALGGCMRQSVPARLEAGAPAPQGPFAPGQEPLFFGGSHPELPAVPAGQQIVRSFHASGRCDDFASAYGCWIVEVAEVDANGAPAAILEQFYLFDAERWEWRLWRVQRYPLGAGRVLHDDTAGG